MRELNISQGRSHKDITGNIESVVGFILQFEREANKLIKEINEADISTKCESVVTGSDEATKKAESANRKVEDLIKSAVTHNEIEGVILESVNGIIDDANSRVEKLEESSRKKGNVISDIKQSIESFNDAVAVLSKDIEGLRTTVSEIKNKESKLEIAPENKITPDIEKKFESINRKFSSLRRDQGNLIDRMHQRVSKLEKK